MAVFQPTYLSFILELAHLFCSYQLQCQLLRLEMWYWLCNNRSLAKSLVPFQASRFRDQLFFLWIWIRILKTRSSFKCVDTLPALDEAVVLICSLFFSKFTMMRCDWKKKKIKLTLNAWYSFSNYFCFVNDFCVIRFTFNRII